MTSYLSQLEDHTQRAILAELSKAKVSLIESQITDEIKDIPPMASGDKIRPQPRHSVPLARFYQACLREMGPVKHGLPKRKAPPSPANAWLEIMRHVADGMGVNEPSFTHKEIVDTIAFFGGWSDMWAEFNSIQMRTARGRFIMAYKDILAGYAK